MATSAEELWRAQRGAELAARRVARSERKVADLEAKLARLKEARVKATETRLAKASETVGKVFDEYAAPDDASLKRFAKEAAKVTRAAQYEAANSAASFVSTYASTAGAKPLRPYNVAPIVNALRNGVDPVEVYERPIITLRHFLAEGDAFATAMRKARMRATSTAATDVALANRAASIDAMRRHPAIQGYQRVPDGKACVFCLLASTQRYHLRDLMPLHANCGCDTVPIIGSVDPGRIVNRDLLARIKAQGIQTERVNPQSEYKRLVQVREHGELGPVLTRKGDSFTGPADI